MSSSQSLKRRPTYWELYSTPAVVPTLSSLITGAFREAFKVGKHPLSFIHTAHLQAVCLETIATQFALVDPIAIGLAQLRDVLQDISMRALRVSMSKAEQQPA